MIDASRTSHLSSTGLYCHQMASETPTQPSPQSYLGHSEADGKDP